MNPKTIRAISRNICFPAAICFATFTCAQEILPSRTLGLQESIKIALENSHELLDSREDVEIAQQRVRESESLFFPKLDLNANWSRFSVDSSRPLLIQPALGSTLLTNSLDKYLYTARADVYQTIYAGGRSRNTLRQANILYDRAKSLNDALFTKVESSAKQSYYDLIFAQQKSLEYAEALRHLKHLSSDEETPLSERIDLEGEISRVRAEMSEASLAEDEARLFYLRTLNIELNTNVVLQGKLETHPVNIDLQKMLAWAAQYRYELRQTEYEEQLDALGVSLSLAERTPTVGVGASYERSSTDLSFQTVNWAGTLNVSLPVSISDMFYGWAKVHERRAEYRQATLKRAETSDQIQTEVRQAFTKYKFWQNEIGPRKEDYRRLQEMTEELRARKGQVFAKSKAECLTLAAQLRYQEAVHGQLVALALLEKAVGHSLDNLSNE